MNKRLTPTQAYNRGLDAGERWARGGAPFPVPCDRVIRDGRLDDWQRGASTWTARRLA